MVNILFCGNGKVLDGINMALISIVKYCKVPLNIYILTMDLSDQNANYVPICNDDVILISEYIKKVNKDSKIELIDVTKIFKSEYVGCVNIENMYSPYAFIRLLADIIPQIPDKILYLDTDILAYGDIEELYNIDISKYEYAACKDYYGKIFINHNYINSGVMLLNFQLIRQTGLFKKCRVMVNTKKLGFPDQTALNKCVQARLFISDKYNSQRRLRKGDVIRHFCKTIRWYPVYKTNKNPMKNYYKIYPKYFPLIHTLNIKPWNVDALHKILKCHEFDDVIETYKKIKKEDKKYETKK